MSDTLRAIAAVAARTALDATPDGDSLDPGSRAQLRVLVEMAEDAVPPEAEGGLGDPADPRTAEARERVRGWMAGHVRAKLGKAVPESLDVPARRQHTGFTCGPAALAAVMAYHGIDRGESDLAGLLHADPVAGTHTDALTVALAKLGLPFRHWDEMSLADLAHLTVGGMPVLCCCQLHDGGHWVVVRGVDDVGVHLMDPAAPGAEVVMPADEWDRRWHDTAADGSRYVRYGIAVGRADG